MSHSTNLKDSIAGFTLIEALVALAIVAIILASIGGLIASSARGVRSIDGYLTRLETTRAIMTALPSRNQLAPGTFLGKMADYQWRINVSPFTAQDNAQAQGRWVPQTIVVTVKSPKGPAINISTVRLLPRATK